MMELILYLIFLMIVIKKIVMIEKICHNEKIFVIIEKICDNKKDL